MTYLIDDVVHIVASAGLWIVTIWRAPRSLVSTGPDRSVWFTIAFLALAGTVDLGPVHRAIDSSVGHPAAGSVVTHTFVILAGLAVIDMWRRVAGGSVVWHHLVGSVAAIATAVIPLLSEPGRVAVASTNEFYDPTWPAVVHWVAYLAVMTWTFCISISVCRGHRRVSAPGPRRTGVTLIAVGCSGGLLYCAWKATVVVGTGFGAGQALVAWDTTVDATVIGPSLLLVATGASYEAVTARMGAARAHVEVWLALRRMHPLWAALVTAAPQVAFDPPRARVVDLWSLRHVHLRLHRRVIEIRDGIAAVSAHVPAGMQRAAARLADTTSGDAQRSAVVEAALVTLGCRLVAMDSPIVTDAARPREALASVLDEARWLVEVVRAAPVATGVADRIEWSQHWQAVN